MGFSERNIMPVLSIGQIPEILGLALLGLIIGRLGIKKVLLLGIFLEALRFTLFSCNVNGIPLYGTISLHGLTYAYFFVTAAIFLDKNCSASTRSGTHQYFALMVGGTSNLIGNILAGVVFENLPQSASGHAVFTLYWIVPMLLSIVGFAGILCFFREHTLN
jgi:MFS family permease